VLHAADLSRRVASCILARFVGEDRDQPAVAGIEVQVILVGLPEVGLLEHERHAQRALPEVDRALLGRSNEGDVVNALHLYLHGRLLRRDKRLVPVEYASLQRKVTSSPDSGIDCALHG
jgi:hypothetical protein